jgi:hypothetical protein
MFRRLVLEDSAAIFTLVAFITAVSIYLGFAWQTLRMKRGQVARFENLPFETPTPAATTSSDPNFIGGARCRQRADVRVSENERPGDKPLHR